MIRTNLNFIFQGNIIETPKKCNVGICDGTGTIPVQENRVRICDCMKPKPKERKKKTFFSYQKPFKTGLEYRLND